MDELTQRQREILLFLVSFQERMGRTPTGPEIARHFGFSDTGTVYQHLGALQQKGAVTLLRLGRGKPMGIRIAGSALRSAERSWPLLGSIPAGPLSESQVDVNGRLRALDDLIPEIRDADYVLTVQGDSMIEAGLQPGQYVVIRPGVEPRENDICAVWVEGEGGTLKYVRHRGGRITLQPANARYTPRDYPADRVRIQGVLVAALAVQHFRR
jgi:repressor LexA